MCKTSSASVRDFISANGALIAGNINNLDNVRIILVSAHRKVYALLENGSFLINAATHCRSFSRNDYFRDIVKVFVQSVFPCLSGNLSQNLVFQMLYLCVKFSHTLPS